MDTFTLGSGFDPLSVLILLIITDDTAVVPLGIFLVTQSRSTKVRDRRVGVHQFIISGPRDAW